jgi:hypothetical protein
MSEESLELYVAPGLSDDNTFNRVVLAGLDVVIPLEIDLDDDPETDDAIRLVDRNGAYARVLEAGDPDMTRDGDAPFLQCTFRLVPPGVYDVDVRLHNEWHTVIGGMEVTRRDVRLLGESFVGERDLGEFAKTEPADESDAADDDGDDDDADAVDCPL